MYITHPTHGAAAWPGKTQQTRKPHRMPTSACTSPGKAEGGTGRPPPIYIYIYIKSTGRGGGGRETSPQPPHRPPAPQEAANPPTPTAPKTGRPKGAPGHPPDTTGNTKPRAAAHREKGHPKHADTHQAKKKRRKNTNSKQGGPEEKGSGDRDHETQDRDNQRPTPQDPKKKTKGMGEGHTPPTATPAHPRDTGGPPGRTGASEAHPRPHTRPNNTSPRRGGVQPQPGPQQTHPHRTPEPGTAGSRRSAHTATHIPQPKPGQEGCRPKPKPNSKHREPQRGKEGRKHKPYPNTPTQDPSQGWRGYENPNPSINRTQAQTPRNSRKPSVHSPGTQAARAMQQTRPNQIRRPGVMLHPKACIALGLEAERATPKRLGTPVPRACMHALGTRYARKSGEPLGYRPKEGRCASTGGHPPGETSTSCWRRSALPMMPGAALLGATSHV